MNSRILSMIAAAGVLIGTPALYAQNANQRQTPGHQMQEKGSVPGHPGASGYAPGHEREGRSDVDRDRGTQGRGDMDRDRGMEGRGDRDRMPTQPRR